VDAVKQLGFNYGAGAFHRVPAIRANATIAEHPTHPVEHWLWDGPGRCRRQLWATRARYAYLVAERPPDDGNRGSSFHVTEGLQPDDNAISMFPSVTHYQVTPAIGTQTFDNSGVRARRLYLPSRQTSVLRRRKCWCSIRKARSFCRPRVDQAGHSAITSSNAPCGQPRELRCTI